MSRHPIDDETLIAYLADALPGEDLARVEKALRESAELRDQLEQVRDGRQDSNLHTLGAIWRRGRLTCATRQQLGSYLLDALDPEIASYITFHVDVIECVFCRANLDDLRSKAAAATSYSTARHNRIIQSSRHLLPEEPNPRK